jgi:hypothetical protein
MVSVIGVINNYSLPRLAYTLLVVLIVFYIFSSLLQRIIMKNVNEALSAKTDGSEEVAEELLNVQSDTIDEQQSISPNNDDVIK